MDGLELGLVRTEGEAATSSRTEAAWTFLLGLGQARVWVFIAAVGVVSAGVWAVDLTGAQPLAPAGGLPVTWWELAVAFYLAEVFVVHLQFRKQAHTLSLTEIGLVLGLLLASPANLLAAQVVGTGLALSIHRRQRPIKLAFNLAELPLCSGIALLIFHSLPHGGPSSVQTWAVVLLAAGIAHSIGVGLVSAVIAVAEAKFAAPELPRTLAVSLVGSLATASLALAGVVLIEVRPLAGLLLVLPAVTCVAAFRAYMSQRERREHLEFLYESMRETQGAPEFGLALGQLLIAARRLLRAEYAEIQLLTSTPGEPILRSVSGSEGETLMHPEKLAPSDELAFERVRSADHPLLLGRRRDTHPLDRFLAGRGLGDAIIGALRGEERVLGLLLVGNRAGDVGTFTDVDRELFETFAGHASVLLENSRLEQSLAQVTELQEELRHQAYHDALTGLPNRVLFTDRLAETLAREAAGARTHAVLFLDLDHFKNINDSWGHATGDELLVQVAERLRRDVRPGDLPARLGGDEFALLLEDTNAAGAEQAAQRIADALSPAFSVSGREAKIHASIGIAVTGPHADTAEELLRNADIAMYAAKNDDHRRSATYEHSLHSRMRHRGRLALELENAVERGELVAHYQPIVSLGDGTIQAFEALVRWQHPERGLLPPSDFLSTAEESGLMIDVGRCVLEQAFRSAQMWEDAVPHTAEIGIWVNLAPSELQNERLVEELALALARSGLDARRLTLEITESSMSRDEQVAIKALRQLRDLGVRLSIDDFGTGYSSLSRLAELPIEMLKIPKTFVDQLEGDATDVGVVDAILRLAGSLGLVTVAEGIEHLSQARRVQQLGCGLGQGYLFSSPIPEDQVFQLLQRPGTTGRPVPAVAAVTVPYLTRLQASSGAQLAADAAA
jgi:diguanylate cyclase (GGDEF)-like protein